MRIGVWYVPSTIAPRPGWLVSDTTRSTERRICRNRDAGFSSVRARMRLDARRLQTESFDQSIEGAHQIVLRVAERLARQRQGIVPRVTRLLGREPQRVVQHLGEIVLHQQRLVFVDGQTGVLFAGPRVPGGRDLW